MLEPTSSFEIVAIGMGTLLVSGGLSYAIVRYQSSHPVDAAGKEARKRFWTKVDYVWLAMSLLGVLNIADQLWRTERLRVHERANRETESTRRIAQHIAHEFARDHLKDAENPNATGFRASHLMAREWFLNCAAALTDLRSTTSWRNYLPGGPAHSWTNDIVPTPAWQTDWRDGAGMIGNRVKEIETALSGASPSLDEPTTFAEVLFKNLAVILLPAALGLRLARTTAELHHLK